MNKRQDYLDLTIPQLLQLRAAEFGDKAALREKEMGVWRNYSWQYYLEMVRCSGLGLLALGFARGDKLAILSDNIPETLFLSIGAQAVGECPPLSIRPVCPRRSPVFSTIFR
jgi:long-chain acyl-CoA synthetase